ncbi:hypothetical protein BDV93DRAFT_606846 [Ceratobasidium sp. AG-I]|nr:hypothetical protein BDV93DRAFT_606846 [Ceratobasidium sp. AG-I]
MENLPEEIIIRFLLYCSYADILHFSMTCRAYHKFVASSSELQLNIELESNGFELSAESRRLGVEGVAVRLLDEFKRYRDGWLYLKLGNPLPLELVDMGMRLYELKQGYYAAVLSSTVASPGIVKLTDLENGFVHNLDLAGDFSEFQIDPSQELVVLVALAGTTSRIYLHSCYTGEAHGKARYPLLKAELPSHTSSRSTRIVIEVLHDILAVKYFTHDKEVSEILIWNWKLGTLLNRIQCFGMSCTFGFLTSSSLILFHSNCSSDASAVKLLVYDKILSPIGLGIDERDSWYVSKYEPMVPCFQLDFPTFPPGTTTNLLMRGEPAPTISASNPATFAPLPIARVLKLNITVSQGDEHVGDSDYYYVFINKEVLLKHLASQAHSAKPVGFPTVIPWEAWGEHATRWFGTASAIPWTFRTYGTRFICTGLFDDENDFNSADHLSILDFHQPTTRRFSSPHLSMWGSKEARQHIDLHAAREDWEHVCNTFKSKQGMTGEDAVFVDTIGEDVPSLTPFNGKTLITRLPYRIVTRIQPVPKRSGWMIDNKHVIRMPGGNFTRGFSNVYTPKA